MLVELEIRDLALIEGLNLELRTGLNVLTGETGAGKSIILDALSLVLGGRAAADMVRTGAGRALVAAEFDVTRLPDHPRLLADLGLPAGDGGTLLVRRELAAGGRARITVNGSVANVSMLKEAAAPLVDLHGQHEFHTLMHPERHLDLLDQYGGSLLRAEGKPLDLLDRYGGGSLLALRGQLASLHAELQTVGRELAALVADDRERARREDLLRFQAQELEAARLHPGEEEELLAERNLLAHAERLQAAAAEAYELIYEGRRGSEAATDGVGRALQGLTDAQRHDLTLAPVVDMLHTALANLEEAARTLAAYRDGIDVSPERLNRVEERLQLLAGLRRKYGDTVTEMLQHLAAVQADLSRLESAVAVADTLRARQADLGRQAETLASQLSAGRRAAAVRLGEQVARELADLGMPAARFEVAVTAPAVPSWSEVTGRGWDHVEFQFSPNPGEPPKPLARIASGGEMSRVMLALKAILARVDGVPTLVFDEIDTGISGRTAQAVAEKLARIAGDRQVLCVTHLPQVAAMADAHFQVVKEVTGGRSVTQVHELDEAGRVEELARMIGGATVTRLTRENAGEMLAAAARQKAELRSARGASSSPATPP